MNRREALARLSMTVFLTLVLITAFLDRTTTPVLAGDYDLIMEYQVLNEGSNPAGGITFTSDGAGNLWFAEEGEGTHVTYPSWIARFTPDSGVLTEWRTRGGSADMLVDSAGKVWYLEYAGGRVGQIDPALNRQTTWPIPSSAGKTVQGPFGISRDSAGRVWFIERTPNLVGILWPGANMSQDQGTFREYRVPTGSSGLIDAVLDANGNFWFTERLGNKLGRFKLLDDGTGIFTEWVVPTSQSRPYGIAVDGAGDPWFVEYATNKIAKFHPDPVQPNTGRFTEYTTPGIGNPFHLNADSLGRILFTEFTGNRVSVLDPSLSTGDSHIVNGIQSASVGPIKTLVSPVTGSITPQARDIAGTVVKAVPSKATGNGFTRYGVISDNARPYDVIASPSQDVWFTEIGGDAPGGDRIGVLTHSTKLPDSSASGVAANPSIVLADGTTASNITVTLRDSQGSPVAGKNVTLSSSRGSVDTIVQPSTPTDDNGQAIGSVRSSIEGTAVVSARDATDGFDLTSTASVQFAAVPNFQLAASPSAQTVIQGASATYSVTVTGASGFGSPVNLTISGLPTNATAIFEPPTVSPNGSSTLAIQSSASTPAGTHTLTVTGTGGGTTRTTTVTLIVSPPPSSDGIFASGFETGNFSDWSLASTNGGGLSVAASGAHSGGFGLAANIQNNTAMYVQDNTPTAESLYGVRFYFDPNNISMAEGDQHTILLSRNSAGAGLFRLNFRQLSGQYQIQAYSVTDPGNILYTSWYTINNDWNAIEIDWKAATSAGANNGYLKLNLNGSLKQTQINLDNDLRTVDNVQLGPLWSIDTGTRGVEYFDDFVSTRESSIGP